MLRLMLAYSRPQLVIAVALFTLGAFLLVSGRGANPLIAVNIGWLFLLAAALWLFGAALNASRTHSRFRVRENSQD